MPLAATLLTVGSLLPSSYDLLCENIVSHAKAAARLHNAGKAAAAEMEAVAAVEAAATAVEWKLLLNMRLMLLALVANALFILSKAAACNPGDSVMKLEMMLLMSKPKQLKTLMQHLLPLKHLLKLNKLNLMMPEM